MSNIGCVIALVNLKTHNLFGIIIKPICFRIGFEDHNPSAVGVISGDSRYPSPEFLEQGIAELTEKAWFVNATNAAAKLGNPIFGNIMMIGALAAVGGLPLDRDDFKTAVSSTIASDKVEENLCAYDMGVQMIRS